jgi:hypothetical protein
MPNKQAYESTYLLFKARRIRDATLKLSHATAPSSAATQDPSAYLARRMGAKLPGVEVGRLEVPTSEKRRNEALVFEQVVRRVMEGMSVELARELAEM